MPYFASVAGLETSLCTSVECSTCLSLGLLRRKGLAVTHEMVIVVSNTRIARYME